MRQILCDTSALVALFDADDRFADLARDYVQGIEPGLTLIVPDTVFGETMTMLKSRVGAKLAVKVGQQLRQSVRFRLYRLSDEDELATWDIFARYTDKNWSYVDCSLLALAQRLKIAEILAFDHYFEQMPDVTRAP